MQVDVNGKILHSSETGKLVHYIHFMLLDLFSFLSMCLTVLSTVSGGACYSNCTV